MKLYIAIVTIFINSLLFGQENEKPIYYLDIDWSQISMDSFNKKTTSLNIHHYIFENDSCVVAKLFQIRTMGQFDSVELNKFYNTLESIVESEIQRNKTILILYISVPNGCFHEISDEVYWLKNTPKSSKRAYRKYKEMSIFNIYWSLEDIPGLRNVKNLFHDKNGLLKEPFFKLNYHCGSGMLVKPDGKYFLRHDEGGSNEILDKLKSGF